MKGFNVLIPLDIDLTSSNVAENDYPAWVAGTYALEARVIVVAEHNIYESLANSNTSDPTGGANADKWVLVGKTNRYKCIDEKVNSQTTNDDSIVMEFAVGKSTALAFLNVECLNLKVEIYDGATQIYDKTIHGRIRNTRGWYSYFFGKFQYKNFFLFEHRLLRGNETYKVTLTGETCKLGVMLKGNLEFLGLTQWGAELGFYDYSKTEADQWGEISLKQGNFRDYFRGELQTRTNNLQIIRKILRARRGKLSLFVPTEHYDMAVYGFAREPVLVWEYIGVSTWSLDIEGVV